MDLSAYPPTRSGAEAIILALSQKLVHLWKSERLHHRSDDLVAIIQTANGNVRLEPRAAIYTKLKKRSPEFNLIGRIINPPPSDRGAVAIWGIIGFPDGQSCVLPVILARS